uniref:Uncharacterized protein n=1 Tax=Micrurus spixii TaxID=129469 RepID=A0A2D4MFK4_9SAUR
MPRIYKFQLKCRYSWLVQNYLNFIVKQNLNEIHMEEKLFLCSLNESISKIENVKINPKISLFQLHAINPCANQQKSANRHKHNRVAAFLTWHSVKKYIVISLFEIFIYHFLK